jgi:hypothetical protein
MLEDEAMRKLRDTRDTGATADILDRAVQQSGAPEWRARIFELAEASFQSIGMQLSVPRYNGLWLERRFADSRTDPTETDSILNWTNPGPGGFYDDLGDPTRQPHLVRSSISLEYRPQWPKFWWTYAESFYDEPLQMRYTGLDPAAQYRTRVVYAGDSPGRKIRLMAGALEIHPLMLKPQPGRPVEFDIPHAATAQGELNLSWYREAGLGGNGRGCEVAEVWLIKK